MQELEQLASGQGLPTDRGTLNKLAAQHASLNNQISSDNQMVGRAALSGSPHSSLALSNYQNMLMRQNSFNSNSNSLQQETPFNNSNQKASSSFQGSASLLAGTMQNSPTNGFSSSQVLQPSHRSLNGSGNVQQNHPQSPHGSQSLQQQMIDQ